MARIQASEVLNRLEEDSDWDESSEEGESGSDDDFTADMDEIDFLTEAQVIYSSFTGKGSAFVLLGEFFSHFPPR